MDKDAAPRMCKLFQISSNLNRSGKHTLNGMINLKILTENNYSLSILKDSKLVKFGELIDLPSFY